LPETHFTLNRARLAPGSRRFQGDGRVPSQVEFPGGIADKHWIASRLEKGRYRRQFEPANMNSIDSLAHEFLYTQDDFERVRALIHRRAGISLSPAKQSMVYSRLSRRLRARGLKSFQQYLDLLESDGHTEWEAFTNCLTTNLTAFFREAHHFTVLAQLLRDWKGRTPITLWSAAVSTGEEAYSMAMTACEAFSSMTPPVRIIASDIDTHVLDIARAGVYSLERAAGVSEERMRRYFVRGGAAPEGSVRVRPELASLVQFQQVNLLSPGWPTLTELGAIFCRNVMIYFDKAAQRRVVDRMRAMMHTQGLLFVGHSESLVFVSDLYRLRGKTVYEPVPPHHRRKADQRHDHLPGAGEP